MVFSAMVHSEVQTRLLRVNHQLALVVTSSNFLFFDRIATSLVVKANLISFPEKGGAELGNETELESLTHCSLL